MVGKRVVEEQIAVYPLFIELHCVEDILLFGQFVEGAFVAPFANEDVGKVLGHLKIIANQPILHFDINYCVLPFQRGGEKELQEGVDF